MGPLVKGKPSLEKPKKKKYEMKEKPGKTEKAKADPRNEENVSFVHRPFMMTTMMALKALPHVVVADARQTMLWYVIRK